MQRNHVFIFSVLLIVLTLWISESAHAKTLEQILHDEPHLDEILQTYFRNEGLTGIELEGLIKKARIAPLLPTLYAGVDIALRENQGLSVTDNISVSSGMVTVGPEDNNLDYDNYSGQTFRVRAMWRLDELVFNRNEWIHTNEKRDYARIRSDLGGRIIKIYEQRLLYLSQYLVMKGQNAIKRELYYQRYVNLTQQLDAMTRRQFAGRWWIK